MTRYAAGTDVTSDRSRAEIERTLRRYGAAEFMYGWTLGQAAIAFSLNGMRIQFRLPLPDPDERRFTHSPARGNRRVESAREAAYEQAIRQRWRALALVIKAKLEAVESGITTVEDEFLAHMVLPNGRTMGETVAPQLAKIIAGDLVPQLMPGGNP